MKLLVVGWDGATHRHLREVAPPFYSSLPHQGKLLPEDLFLGAYIDSANAWTTITTGVPFRDHRVLVFRYPPMRTDSVPFKVLSAVGGRRFLPEQVRRAVLNRVMGPLCRERPDAGARDSDERWGGHLKGRLMPAVSTDVHFPRFWDLLPGRSVIFEVPLTYPAMKTRGILVSGIPAPAYGQAKYATVYPRALEADVRGRFLGYMYGEGGSPVEDPSRPNLDRYLKTIPEVQEQAADAFVDLARREDFELGLFMARIIDDYLHADDSWSEVRRAYERVDAITKRVVEETNPDHVLILSDHGMKRFRRPGLGIRMDHDTTQGIWASDLDLGLRRQVDVAPAVLGVFGQVFRRERRRPELEENEDVDLLDESEMQEVEDRLRYLGYL